MLAESLAAELADLADEDLANHEIGWAVSGPVYLPRPHDVAQAESSSHDPDPQATEASADVEAGWAIVQDGSDIKDEVENPPDLRNSTSSAHKRAHDDDDDDEDDSSQVSLPSPYIAPRQPAPRVSAHSKEGDHILKRFCSRNTDWVRDKSVSSITSSYTATPPPTMPPRPTKTNGDLSRVEITFESLFDQLLAHRQSQPTIRDIAEGVASSEKLKVALAEYLELVRDDEHWKGAGRRKNAVVRIMNCILDEADHLGLDSVAPAHKLRYGRYSDDGRKHSEYDPSRKSDPNYDELNYWRHKSQMPAMGCIEPALGSTVPEKDAKWWNRCAILLDVTDTARGRRYDYEEQEISKGFRSAKGDLYPPKPTDPLERPVPQSKYSTPPMPHPQLSWDAPDDRVQRADDEMIGWSSKVFHTAHGNRQHILGLHVLERQARFYVIDHAGVMYTTHLDLADADDLVRFVEAVLGVSMLDVHGLGYEPLYVPLSGTPTVEDFIDPIGRCTVDISGTRFHLNSFLHAEGIQGRGSTVFTGSAVKKPRTSSRLPDEVVIKICWQVSSVPLEDELLKLAEQNRVKGIIRRYGSDVGRWLSDDLRGRLIPHGGMYGDRQMRLQITGPILFPLYRVDKIEDFKKAFRSLVVAHHDLWERTRILHKDIGPQNLMVKESNHREGILMDFDISARIAPDGKPITGGAFPSAGIPMTRSVDLCTELPQTIAYYRHDLESFFYSLIWCDERQWRHDCAVSYNPFSSQYSTPDIFDLRADGRGTALDDLKSRKRAFLAMHKSRYSQLPPSPLRDEWIVPLRTLFAEAYDARDKAKRDDDDVEFDEATLGGAITFESFYEIIKEKPTARQPESGIWKTTVQTLQNFAASFV